MKEKKRWLVIMIVLSLFLIGCSKTVPEEKTFHDNNIFTEAETDKKNAKDLDSTKDTESMGNFDLTVTLEPIATPMPNIEETPVEFFEWGETLQGTIYIKSFNSNLPANISIPKEINGKVVTSIGENAFRDCDILVNVEIPSSITDIGAYAFYGCRNLTGIKIPDSVTYIGGDAFCDTPWCRQIVNEKKALVVNGILLDVCGGLTEFTIPDGVTSIADYAFDEYEYRPYDGLTRVVIPDGVISIGNEVFSYCESLIDIEIPKSVTSIGISTFQGTPWYNQILDEKGVVIVNNILLDVREDVTEFIIPDGVICIGSFAFAGCKNLTGIKIPESVTRIEYYAFKGCENLTSIEITENVTDIGGAVFYGCDDLTIKTVVGSFAEKYGELYDIPVEIY